MKYLSNLEEFSFFVFIFQLKSLDGLSKFVAVGNLNLSNNDLTWHELGKIRHLHILNLSFHGNHQLEKEPYCK
jgi:hypothetical protein